MQNLLLLESYLSLIQLPFTDAKRELKWLSLKNILVEIILGIVIPIAHCRVHCYQNGSVKLLWMYEAIFIIHFWHTFWAAAFTVDFRFLPLIIWVVYCFLCILITTSNHPSTGIYLSWIQYFCTFQAGVDSWILSVPRFILMDCNHFRNIHCCTQSLPGVLSELHFIRLYLITKSWKPMFLERFLTTLCNCCNNFPMKMSKCTLPNELCGAPWRCINIIIPALWVGNLSNEEERWRI